MDGGAIYAIVIIFIIALGAPLGLILLLSNSKRKTFNNKS